MEHLAFWFHPDECGIRGKSYPLLYADEEMQFSIIPIQSAPSFVLPHLLYGFCILRINSKQMGEGREGEGLDNNINWVYIIADKY
jgi:hypothetical protein